MDIVFFFSIASFLTILLQVIEVHNFLMMKFLVGKRPISTKLDLIFPIPPSFNFSTKIQDQMLNLFLRSSRILGEIQWNCSDMKYSTKQGNHSKNRILYRILVLINKVIPLILWNQQVIQLNFVYDSLFVI
jgi:hypothetical protein